MGFFPPTISDPMTAPMGAPWLHEHARRAVPGGAFEGYDAQRNALKPAGMKAGGQTQGPAPIAPPAIDPGLLPKETVLALQKATKPAEREAAAVALIEWMRENTPDPKLVEAYLARPDIDEADKTATIGKLVVAMAKAELVLGWAHEGGVGKAGKWGWEGRPAKGKEANGGNNRGAFVSHYQDATSGGSGAWCTKFAGHFYLRTGLRLPKDNLKTRRDESTKGHRALWSGSRHMEWATKGTAGGTRMTAKEDVVTKANNSSKLVAAGRWGRLKRQLTGADKARGQTPESKAAKRTELTAAFMKKNGAPQPGDLLILGKNNSFKRGASSHTALVESYDAASHTLITIEGNLGGVVTSRKLDLTDPETISAIVFTSRIGAEHLGPKERKAPEPSPDPAVAADPAAATDPAAMAAFEAAKQMAAEAKKGPSAEDLLGPLTGCNRTLVELSQQRNWLKSDSVDASSFELLHGKNAAGGLGTKPTR